MLSIIVLSLQKTTTAPVPQDTTAEVPDAELEVSLG